MNLSNIISTITERALGDIIFYVFLILAFIVVRFIARITITRYFKVLYHKAKSKSKGVKKDRFETLSTAIIKLINALLWAFIILAILLHYNVNVAFLLSGAGAMGIFLGIAGKDILMDLYTGAMVLIEGQYVLGDVVKINDQHTGTVEDITLRTVVLRDIDGNLHIVPHSVATSVINMTPDHNNVRVDFGVSYNSDLKKVKETIDNVGKELAKDTDWKEDFVTPILFDRTLSFDDSAITVRAIGKVNSGRQWAVSGEFRSRIKVAFDKHGLEIPYPQRTVYIKEKPEPK